MMNVAHSVYLIVIPAKAGILSHYKNWIPAFAGMTRLDAKVCSL